MIEQVLCYCMCCYVLFFFFKQKTAYEMRISDRSSDVCSSDLNKAPYPPQAAIFAKGSEAEKLIIVALVDGRIDTLYRARAIFAQMTAVARLLPMFSPLGVEDVYTFFDLAKIPGDRKSVG